jgi:hypothetical protein
MDQLPGTITVTIALLTVLLVFITALKYAVPDDFARTRAIMTSFFFFIIATLTISFWRYAMATLPFTIPAFFIGSVVGYIVGVRAAEKKLTAQGLAHYMEHFAHVHARDLRKLNWWSVINFYSIMGALVLINFVGLSTVIFRQSQDLAILTSAVGAFLLGTIAPYLLHLWSIRTKRAATARSPRKK